MSATLFSITSHYNITLYTWVIGICHVLISSTGGENMIKLIKNGKVYAPEYLGVQSVLLVGDKIATIGAINEDDLKLHDVELEVIDASGMIVLPGLIDPHVHLIGGGGEGGYATRTPEIQLSEIIRAGITTVVGCLGTDGTTRHMTSLLAKARGLEEEGISTYIYSGNYHIPTPTITGCVKDDVILIDKVIGAGEIALADSRSAQPSLHEVAKLAAEARIGGLLSGKAGVTHFHIGPGKQRLTYLHQLLEEYEIPASKLYCTHITRNVELLRDAISLAAKGCYVDMTACENTTEYVEYYKDNNGDLTRLTISSDGNGSLPVFDDRGHMIRLGVASPYTLFEQFQQLVKRGVLDMEQAVSLVSTNTAQALNLSSKGRISKGYDADLSIISEQAYELSFVLSKGQIMMKDGKVIVKGTFEQ